MGVRPTSGRIPWIGFRGSMRFFEYESREIVRRAGIPTTKFGFARTAEEARAIAADIGGPVVIKSQVLTGGRMKAGGGAFPHTPHEAGPDPQPRTHPNDNRA